LTRSALSSTLCLLGALVLGACGTTGTTGLAVPSANARADTAAGFVLSGRFSLGQDGKNHVGRLQWRHTATRDEFLLSSPLGQGMAEIVSDTDGARMTSADGQTRAAATADELLQSLLGDTVPLDKLIDWLRGRNTNDGHLALDAAGRPLLLRQREWQIEYAYDTDDANALPGRLFIDRADGLQLRLRIEHWETLPNSDQIK
jgi:outer membrane lipoprotein LolB